MQDIKISSLRLNSRDEITFKITAKKEDYTPVELQLLKNAEINWDLLDLAFTWLTNWDTEKVRKEKLVKLNWLMSVYCEKSNVWIDFEKLKLYTRNKVKSRTDLTDSQLDAEIDIYKTWLMEFIF